MKRGNGVKGTVNKNLPMKVDPPCFPRSYRCLPELPVNALTRAQRLVSDRVAVEFSVAPSQLELQEETVNHVDIQTVVIRDTRAQQCNTRNFSCVNDNSGERFTKHARWATPLGNRKQ